MNRTQIAEVTNYVGQLIPNSDGRQFDKVLVPQFIWFEHTLLRKSLLLIFATKTVLNWRMPPFLLVYGLLESSSFKSQGHRHVIHISFSNSSFKMNLFHTILSLCIKIGKIKKKTLHGPYLVPLLDLTPIFEQYVQHGVKNDHAKSMCCNESGLGAQNTNTNLDSMISPYLEGLYDHLETKRFFNLQFYKLCISFPILKT